MAIYNKSGNALNVAYNKNGISIDAAYNKAGVQIFDSQPGLRVMTYNVGQWYIGSGTNVPAEKDTQYYSLQNGMIRRAHADIMFLNEYWDVFSKANRTALSMLSQYFPYIETRNGDSGYFGRTICSKFSISNYTTHTFSVGNGQYYDSCTVTIDGKETTLVVTHLRSNNNRIPQLNELITYLGTLSRFIVGGDFNMLDCKSVSGADYTSMMTPLLNAGFHCANCSGLGFKITYSDEPDGTWTGCLDNIVTSGNITILSASVDTTKLTDSINDKVDHMPLIATVQL